MLMIFLAVESLLLVAGVWTHRRSNADILWLSAIAVSFSTVYCLTHIQVRYRAPMEAIVAVLAAAALAQLWSRVASSPEVENDRRGHVSP